MRVPLCFIAFLFIAAVNATAALPALQFKRESVANSPQRDLLIEFYIDDRAESKSVWVHQIWLSSVKDPKEKVLLCQFERSASVSISPDENKLVVNDCDGSDHASVRLFKKQQGLRYREIKKPSIEEAVWNNAGRQEHFQPSWFHHSYTTCLGWDKDSQTIQVKIDGYGDVGGLEGWVCFYNISTKKITFDATDTARYGLPSFTKWERKTNESLSQ